MSAKHYFLVHGLVLAENRQIPVTSVVFSNTKDVNLLSLTTMGESLKKEVEEMLEGELHAQVQSFSYMGLMTPERFLETPKEQGKKELSKELMESPVKNQIQEMQDMTQKLKEQMERINEMFKEN